MGWFDDQIQERINGDNELFSESFEKMAKAITCEKFTQSLNDDRSKAKDAIDEILKYYGIRSQELPDEITTIDEELEYLMRSSGVMRRIVKLDKNWPYVTFGPLLATNTETGKPLALIPSKVVGYTMYDPEQQKSVPVTAKNAHLVSEDAYCFYRPLPQGPITTKDLLMYIWKSLSVSDLVQVGGAGLIVAGVGMVMPALSSFIYSKLVLSQNMTALFAVFIFLACAEISKVIFTALKNTVVERIAKKISLSTEAAMMMRILALPAKVFKEYGSGSIAKRLTYMSEFCSYLTNIIFSTGLTTILSIVYIFQMFYYTPSLVFPALTLIILSVILSIMAAVAKVQLFRDVLREQTADWAVTQSLLNGIQKIKIAGAEKRAFAKWADQWAKVVAVQYSPVIPYGTFLTLLNAGVIYYFAIVSKTSMGDYYAFASAFGLVSSAFSTLVSTGEKTAMMWSILKMLQPIMDATPEIEEEKRVITHLSGGIELNNVSFRYKDSLPLILDNLTLKIRPGQYVGIVGKTGCGKSTLMRLMLGFEKPQKGAIYYDGQDVQSIDLKSLRQHIGTVMQNGSLFQGDIFSNITISAPQLTLDEAWEAAEEAGMAEDIRSMPMGMHTLISEGSGGISGGQRQRIMIARAIAPKPKILMFDEATSALDNITQKIVSDSLEKLKCTRVVIAHRLSTIKECDRILVLDQGKIIEDGTYDELIAKNGFFAELVKKQRVDND